MSRPRGGPRERRQWAASPLREPLMEAVRAKHAEALRRAHGEGEDSTDGGTTPRVDSGTEQADGGVPDSGLPVARRRGE